MTLLVVLHQNGATLEKTLTTGSTVTSTSKRTDKKTLVYASVPYPYENKKVTASKINSTTISQRVYKSWPKKVAALVSLIQFRQKTILKTPLVSSTVSSTNKRNVSLVKQVLTTPVNTLTKAWSGLKSIAESISTKLTKKDSSTKSLSNTVNGIEHKQINKAYTSSSTVTSTRTKTVNKVLKKTSNVIQSLFKNITQSRSSNSISMTATRTKKVNLVKKVSSTILSTFGQLKVLFLTLKVTVTESALVKRTISKIYLLTSVTQNRLTKAITHRFNATVSVIGNLFKNTVSRKVSTSSVTGSFARRAIKFLQLQVSRPIVSSLKKSVTKYTSIQVNPIVSIRKVITHSFKAIQSIISIRKLITIKGLKSTFASSSSKSFRFVRLLTVSAQSTVNTFVKKRIIQLRKASLSFTANVKKQFNKIISKNVSILSNRVKNLTRTVKVNVATVARALRTRFLTLFSSLITNAHQSIFNGAGWMKSIKKYYVSVTRYGANVTRKKVITVEEADSKKGTSDLG